MSKMTFDERIHVKLVIMRHESRTGLNDEFDLQYFEDHWSGVEWVDRMLDAITGGKFNLMSKLNDIQTECTPPNSEAETFFPSKRDIPLLLVNMAIEKFNLEFRRCR